MFPKKYEEHHFQNIEDVGVAWNHDKVWVCLNGGALFRAKIMGKKLFVEYYPLINKEEKHA